MIKNSFIFLERINAKKEQNIWNQGIRNWNDFLKAEKINGISKISKKFYDRKIKEAKDHLLEQDPPYFSSIFPSAEHWRLYDEFKDEALFLDIESDSKKITLIGMFDGYETKSMLGFFDKKILEKEINKKKILVTFNGKSFDVPVLEKYFNIKIKIPHIDLVHVCRRIGLKGGLKAVEKELGISRRKILDPVKGHDAAELWRCFHATGDKDFLDMMIAYNEEDCINLKRIADYSVKKLWSQTSFSL